MAPASQCWSLDPMDVGGHQNGGRSIFLATHVLENLQRRACDVHFSRCAGQVHWENVALDDVEPGRGPGCLQRSHFMADVEQAQVAIEHHLQSRHGSDLAWGVRDMKGALLDSSGRALLQLDGSRRDVLTVQALLEAAGVSSLDEACDSGRSLDPCAAWQQKHPRACCEDFGPSLRARGMFLELDIVYSNLDGAGLVPHSVPSYTLRVRRVPRAEAYRNHVLHGCGAFSDGKVCNQSTSCAGCLGEHRVFRLSSGIQLSVHQLGVIGHASLSHLFLWIFGLSSALTMSWNVCEFLIEYIPGTRRELYPEVQKVHHE